MQVRSRENIKNHGEVFTPDHIVLKMMDLIPESAWRDPEFVFLEPTCGSGNFLVRILGRRVDSGIHIETAMNTMIGMDISQLNIFESHQRLYSIVADYMRNHNIAPQSKRWFQCAIRAVAIVSNNIFVVDDSLKYIREQRLKKKRFFFKDPTGKGQVLDTAEQQAILSQIHKRMLRYKKDRTINEPFAPFFEET